MNFLSVENVAADSRRRLDEIRGIAEREFAYDRDFSLSPLVEALDRAAEYGITVVRMARDWKAVFPAPNSAGP